MSFDSLGLDAKILEAIHEQNYTKPTPIQQQAIPIILSGKDLMASAQTGTGKTAGFGLPILQKLVEQQAKTSNRSEPKKGKRPLYALILAPTRELAAQIGENIRDYSRYLPIRSLVVFGGVSINPQMMKLRGGVDILIATPGRLLDLVHQNAVDLSSVKMLVLDEADRMLDMGFIHDIRRVIAKLPKKRQNLMFSATFSDEIKALAQTILNAPESVAVAKTNSASEQITQYVHRVDKRRKRELLSYIIGRDQWQQVLIFTRTKYGANHLADQLTKDGIKAAAIHGNKSQGARTKALADFKNGQIRALVATDIAARGLDIELLPYVVNYELPQVAEDYVHRIGRTGRAQNQGQAISFVCVDELAQLKSIEKLIKKTIPEIFTQGFEVDPRIKAEPVNKATAKRAPKKRRRVDKTRTSKNNQNSMKQSNHHTYSKTH
ncbi:ATP-dependent RNA helicase RhlE [Gilliamella sp. B2776]|uniref:ATP-dependent RNA helicase RhlE n=1 Tax=unclassified Gilliamella TaxID=2685620 RepID=UPI00226A4C0E|nr:MULTISPECIES: ATP-dependent RNA helicase RhlE [unclassified Gilliamella]MCX8649641.1 ATP-dependent RNA helicase RhlE [Gilliamella sp. B2779]MCX8654841.1 ATP-dependent RNA helicase RhlE [Gilliamella sp. B2737]MCX8656945.1 ATP-dependent RNA helicase RhlE [Gilliamella sp. B2894]MCX8665027.1 ATP-dependent RNA helicase RhlE [Gilliamella sp. B2887]MCX8691369.1 ATP-dependent RNA helicase RhlE [Gilliamella sp. B2776]